MPKYIPVFVGKTPENDQIVLYKEDGNLDGLHLLKPDGEFVALESASVSIIEFDIMTAVAYLEIKSEVWSGRAAGSKEDLFNAEIR